MVTAISWGLIPLASLTITGSLLMCGMWWFDWLRQSLSLEVAGEGSAAGMIDGWGLLSHRDPRWVALGVVAPSGAHEELQEKLRNDVGTPPGAADAAVSFCNVEFCCRWSTVNAEIKWFHRE